MNPWLTLSCMRFVLLIVFFHLCLCLVDLAMGTLFFFFLLFVSSILIKCAREIERQMHIKNECTA